MSAIIETAPGLVEWPLTAGFETAVRCVCIVQSAPPVPSPTAVGIYVLGVIGAALAAYGLGRVHRIRSRVRP